LKVPCASTLNNGFGCTGDGKPDHIHPAEAVKEQEMGVGQLPMPRVRVLRQNLSKTGTYLIIIFGLLLPLSTAAGTAVAMAIILCFLLQGNLKEQVKRFRKNKIVIALAAFIMLHVVGLLWTQDIAWGLHMINKQWRLLLVPMIMVFVRREHIPYYFDSYLSGMTLLCFLSYLNLLQVVTIMPMTHVSYNPLLALAIYLLLHSLLFGRPDGWKKAVYGVLLIIMTANLFLTIGRTGYLVFFVLIILVCLQFFRRRPLKALATSFGVLLVVFFLSYHFSSMFYTRVNGAVDEIQNFQMNKQSTSGNDRITFFLNTFEIIKEHPLLGVGTGDFPREYEKINRIRSPNVVSTVNPHNNYLLVQAQFGVIGLLSLLSIFYYQIRYSRNTQNSFRHLRLALPVFFLTIMLFDAYLMSHYGGMTFAYFSAILYGDFDGV
jgi:O-antigen ligase